MPRVDVAELPGLVPAALPPVAVVIDVLRATTMIAALLDAGCAGIRAVAGIADARDAREREPDALLGGERGGVPPEGFDLGNSPARVSPEMVRGRVVILSTTNGTAAIERVRLAEVCVTAALTNLDAVAERLASFGRDTLIVCSGTDGAPSDEDGLAAGLLVDRLRGWTRTPAADAAFERATGSVGASGGIPAAVARSSHARRLTELGFEDDVRFCARRSVTDTVPVLDAARGLIVAG